MNKIKSRKRRNIIDETTHKQISNFYNFEIDYEKLADAIVKAELRVKESGSNKDYEEISRKRRFIDYVSLIIGLCFYPKHMKGTAKDIHYNLLLVIVSMIFDIIGYGLSIFGLLIIAGSILLIIDKGFIPQVLLNFMCSFISLLYGGAFRLAEKELNKAKNETENILSYFSAFFGFLSFIVAIIAIIISINH